MADEIDTVLDELFNARESYSALRDMYPPTDALVLAEAVRIATLKQKLIAVAIRAERKRCYDIVMAVRFHEIETDLRSVLSFIERGDTAEELKAERLQHR